MKSPGYEASPESSHVRRPVDSSSVHGRCDDADDGLACPGQSRALSPAEHGQREASERGNTCGTSRDGREWSKAFLFPLETREAADSGASSSSTRA